MNVKNETEYSNVPIRLDLLTAGLRMAYCYCIWCTFIFRVVVRSRDGPLS
jgi:hypothetical protein